MQIWNLYLRPAEQLFKLQIPLGFGGGQALAEDGGFVRWFISKTKHSDFLTPYNLYFNRTWRVSAWSCRNVLVNQTLTARTVGLVGGVLAGFALALTGPIWSYSRSCWFFLSPRAKRTAADNLLHPQADGLVFSDPLSICFKLFKIVAKLSSPTVFQ